MVKIVGGLLCKNENGRWLKQYLEQMKILCDDIVVVDDISTDNTAEICLEYTRNVLRNSVYNFEDNESYLRELLFNQCARLCNDNDWIVILDADELLCNIEKLRSLLISYTSNIKCINLQLFDMWNDKQYRADNYWTAHLRYWLMCVRPIKGFNYTWNRSKLHCGRWPLEVYNQEQFRPTDDIYIKHMGWSTEQDRKNKYDRYIKLDGKGEFGILEQYESILDPNPNLVTL